MSHSKRARKPTRKVLEFAAESDTVEKQKRDVWCTVELVKSDGEKIEYTVNSKYLETESGQAVSEAHLHMNSKVIWKSKGKPFEVTILDTHRTKPMTKKKKMIIANSGSSSSEDEDVTSAKKTQVDDADADNISSSPHSDEKNSLEAPAHMTPKVNKTMNDSGFAVPFTQLSQSATPTCSSNTRTIPERLTRIERKIDNMLTLLKNSGYSSCSSDGTKESETKSKFITESGVDPSKYALQLMDILFTDQEMASSCYVACTKKTKKPGLDPVRVTLLEDCVKAKFKYDDSSFQAHAGIIRRKGTQKCLDKARLLKKESSTKE